MKQCKLIIAAITVPIVLYEANCFAEAGAIFSGTGTGTSVASYNFTSTTLVRSGDIFQKHLGASNPVQWGKTLTGNVSLNFVSTSSQWKAVKRDLLKVFGRDVQVQRYIDYQEYRMKRIVGISNFATARSLDIKGSLAESIMDDFYKKDGWEILDGKRGRNGFDGLYVKRNPNGKIIDWIAADAKSGNAKLSMTQRGTQLSPEWLKGNLNDLSARAKDEYMRNPTSMNKQKVADFENILKLPGRVPRIFSVKIATCNGTVCHKFEHIGINGSPVGKPVFIDMQTRNVNRFMRSRRSEIYAHLEKHIANAEVDPVRTKAIVAKIQKSFEAGEIKTDSDLYRFIKHEIPNKQLANAVSERLGEVPLRGSLAGKVGQALSCNKGAMISSGKKITGKSMEQTVAKIAPTLGRIVGGTTQVGFSVVLIGMIINDYYHGRITQTDAVVQVSIVTLTTAGTVFFTCTNVGTAICPGFGTAIGIGIGVIGGVASSGYMWYAETQRQKRLEYEIACRAKWETQNNTQRLEQRIQELEISAKKKQANAWAVLLTSQI